MSDELKPCPFCGGEALIGQTLDNAWYAMCAKDHCSKLECYWRTKAEAITAWNTRAPSADHIANAGKMITPGYEELEDLIENAIMESIGLDWVPRDGAKAVVRVLQEEGYIGPVNADLATIAWLDGAHRGKAEAARWQAIAEGLAGALGPFAKASEIRLCGGDYWTDEKTIQGTDIAFHITFGSLSAARAALATYTAAKETK